MDSVYVLLVGIFLELLFDWPRSFYKVIKHPIVWMGSLIKKFDIIMNKSFYSNKSKKVLGFTVVFLCLTIGISLYFLITLILENSFLFDLFNILLVWSMICSRSLFIHINEIKIELSKNNLSLARRSLSKVVGRDTKKLKKNEIIRASLESLSESTSDGIIAPIFWYFILGFPGIIMYKTINTLDSMIGYKSKKYLAFGYASAKADDIVNFIPSRLTGLIFAIVSSKPKDSLNIMFKYASRHKSVNAGWPESALAGALSVRLGGPKIYFGVSNNEEWLNSRGLEPNEKKLEEGLFLYKKLIILVLCFLSLISIFNFIQIL